MAEDRIDYLSRGEFEQFERNVSKSFEDLASSMRRQGDELATALAQQALKIDEIRSTGTDWRAIFAGMGVLLAILTTVGGVIAYGMNSKMDTNTRMFEKHVDLKGHPEALQMQNTASARITSLEKEVSGLDSILQREMRILDDRIQAEMRLLDSHQEEVAEARREKVIESLSAITARIDKIEMNLEQRHGRRWNRDDYEDEVLPYLKEHASRIRAIEILLAKEQAKSEAALGIIGDVKDEQIRRIDKFYQEPKK